VSQEYHKKRPRCKARFALRPRAPLFFLAPFSAALRPRAPPPAPRPEAVATRSPHRRRRFISPRRLRRATKTSYRRRRFNYDHGQRPWLLKPRIAEGDSIIAAEGREIFFGGRKAPGRLRPGAEALFNRGLVCRYPIFPARLLGPVLLRWTLHLLAQRT
jgi:hypothetical protein